MNTVTVSPNHVTVASLSYWQLLRIRFTRNRYGMVGVVVVALILLIGIFSSFLSPYPPILKSLQRQYYPPQSIHFFDHTGKFHFRPFVYGYKEEMDPETYEFTYTPDPQLRYPIRFFIVGKTWSLLGIEFRMRWFGVDDGHVHLLGTDNLGRDVFSRMLDGTRLTLLMALLVVATAALIGVVVGTCSGYFVGWFDLIVQRVVEFVLSFPDLPLYLALIALLPKRSDPILVFIMFASVLVLLRWAQLSREVRGKVLAMRSMEYVRAAEAVGASDLRILFRHILPNNFSHIIVWVTYQLPEVILLESFLSFLGVGIQPPMVSWGSMLNQILDFQSFGAAPWMMSPVLMIIITVLAFNAFGDGLRDAVDPYADL